MHNVYQPDSDFRKELDRIISGQRFTINAKKTRLNHCSSRQEVTGLTVGLKINVTRKFVKDIRAILHIWEKYGMNAAYATFYPRYKSEKCQLHRGEPNLENVISGKLCYLKMIKGENDPVYIKLHNQFVSLTAKADVSDNMPNIDYLFTMPKTDFEDKLGVTIEFRERVEDKKKYGCFKFHDRFFVVAVSKNLDVNNLPDNVQISLTRMQKPIEIYSLPEHSRLEALPTVTRLGYLLHKPLRGYRSEQNVQCNPTDVTDELKSFVLNLANSYPELQFKGDMSVVESYKSDNLLALLVESHFDLSILP